MADHCLPSAIAGNVDGGELANEPPPVQLIGPSVQSVFSGAGSGARATCRVAKPAPQPRRVRAGRAIDRHYTGGMARMTGQHEEAVSVANSIQPQPSTPTA